DGRRNHELWNVHQRLHRVQQLAQRLLLLVQRPDRDLPDPQARHLRLQVDAPLTSSQDPAPAHGHRSSSSGTTELDARSFFFLERRRATRAIPNQTSCRASGTQGATSTPWTATAAWYHEKQKA